MHIHSNKSAENKSNAVANNSSKERKDSGPAVSLQMTLQEMADSSPRAKQLKAYQAMADSHSATMPVAQFATTLQLNGGRPSLAERQARLRREMYARQIMQGVAGLGKQEARRYATLYPGHAIVQIIALANGRPAHRNVNEMTILAGALPACTIPEILTLAAAPNRISANDLIAICNAGMPARNANDITELINRAPALQANEIATLIRIQVPRPVQQIALLGRQKPPHRSFDEIATLADQLPGIAAPNLVLVLGLPATRSLRHLRKLVLNKPPSRSIQFMEGLARILRNVSIDNIISLAALPPAREMILQQLVNNKPAAISLSDMAGLAAGLPLFRGLNDIVTLSALRNTMSVVEIIQLGAVPAHRSANDLVTLARGLAGRPVADIAAIASIAPAAGMNPNLILDFVTDTQAFGLTALQIQEAARLPALLNVAHTHVFITNILGAAHLLPSLHDVCTVIQGGANLPKQALILCMTRAPGNLPNLILHVADLNTAAGSYNDVPQISRILGSDTLVSHGNDVNTVIAGAGNMRIPPLIDCMLRAPGNLANLVLRIAGLNAAAGILATVPLKTAMLGSDMLVANGHTVAALLANVHNIDLAALVSAMRVSLGRLNQLNTYMVDIDRALTGQAAVTGQKLINVLNHIVQTGAAAPLGAGHDTGLRRAQAFGAETQNVLNSRIGLPGNVAYLNNLQRAVDSLTGVVWGHRGGNFNRTGWNGNFGGNIRVPVTVNGFNLTNHVIAHLINPQDAGHRVTISNITAATNNFAGPVYDDYNGGYRDHYIGGGMTMIAPTGMHDIITLFFH